MRILRNNETVDRLLKGRENEKPKGFVDCVNLMRHRIRTVNSVWSWGVETFLSFNEINLAQLSS